MKNKMIRALRAMEYATDNQLTVSLTPRKEMVSWPTRHEFDDAGKDWTTSWGRFVAIMENGEPNYWHTKEYEMAIQTCSDSVKLIEWAETLQSLIAHNLVSSSNLDIGAPTPMGMLFLDLANEFDRVKEDLEDEIRWLRSDLEGEIGSLKDSK